MRNAFWLALIAGSLAAIIAGYVQGTLRTQPPPIAQLRARAENADAVAPILGHDAETEIEDVFARDDVVVERRRTQPSQWQPERLAIVVGICGHSVAAESVFLRIDVPLTFVVDASAAQAGAFAQLARSNGDALFAQVADPPGPEALAAIKRAIGPFDGIASRRAGGMPMALHGTGLAFFDERGDAANELAFEWLGVPLVRRDVTADNRSSTGYVRFMLERAAALSRRGGPVVVFVRPLPSTAAALRAFTASHDVRMIALQ